ncbi:MAG: preprotein translocase subunit SecA [Flavobacteriales bacterium]|nr:preprotein translocase subunit SecA [Flavobacteriales bacterium]
MINLINNLAKKFFGTKADKDIQEIQPIVDQVNQAFAGLQNLTDDQLRAKTAEFKKKIADHLAQEQKQIDELTARAETPDTDVEEKERIYDEIDKIEESTKDKVEEVLMEILPEAFAVVKETARRWKEKGSLTVSATEMDRDLAATKGYVTIDGDKATFPKSWTAGGAEITWDMLHYDVQLVGGVALHQGKIAEMATGEGKTLVATLPVYLNALAGRGVHVVTVNDYLAKRDSEWMGPLYEFHGLKVDCIDKHQPNSPERRAAYNADITFGTNNEFGFDYLRDNMAREAGDLVQRKHNYAIVDEVDSVFIDDARTPLIISGPVPKGDQHEFDELKPKVEKLINVQKTLFNTQLADAKKLIAAGNDGYKEGEGGMALLRCHRALPKNKALIKFLSEPGVKQILQKTENYYMQDQNKEMHKVDAELFFVIDEKNNTIELTEKGLELITRNMEDDQFFVLTDVGSGIAEIEKMEISDQEKAKKKDELMRDFAIKSARVHSMNQLFKAYTLFEKDVEYVVLDNKVKIVDEQTGRIMDGRRYSDGLHQAIEAKENLKVEAATQTWATVTLQNYFRMYSKLSGMTGTAETEAKELWDIYKLDVMVIPTNRPIAREDKDDLVYKTAREKYNAVIDEIVNLTGQGRPVLVGTTSVEISELLSRMLKMKKINHSVLNAKLHAQEADVVANAGKPGAVTIATNMAGRGTDIKLGPGVKEAGGLAIIGTERHESRRVDRQLRGRAGRQGDPGSSQFYVSLEDNLMRLFGSDRIAKLMDRMGYEEGEVIQHGMVSKSIERAQKKVEENNYGIRKRLLEYDDVMNAQREVIYKRRRHALQGERLSVDVLNMIHDTAATLVEEFHEMKDYEGFKLEVIRVFSSESPVTEEEFNSLKIDDLIHKSVHNLIEGYKRKKASIAERAFPVIANVFETQGDKFKNIVIPFTDGIKSMNVVVNLQKTYELQGSNLPLAFEKNIILAIIDDQWKEHLREMDELKTSVQNASYEQKDPLLIYKFESFNLFQKMLDRMNREVISFLFKGDLPNAENTRVREAQEKKERVTASRPELAAQRQAAPAPAQNGGQQQPLPTQPQSKPEPVTVGEKIGRNDPCPCGSGKKYKQCHGKA